MAKTARQSTNTFQHALAEHVEPVLVRYGYNLAGTPTHESATFVKRLPQRATAEIGVYCGSDNPEALVSFSAMLVRRKLTRRSQSAYDGGLAVQLDGLLQSLNVPEAAQSSYIQRHHSAATVNYAVGLAELVRLIVRYGLPWLEDPATRQPGFIPLITRKEFRACVLELAGPVLEPLGYTQLARQLDAGVFFRKQLPRGRFAHIFWQISWNIIADTPEFQILLVRNRGRQALRFRRSTSPGRLTIYLPELYETLTNLLPPKWQRRLTFGYTTAWRFKSMAQLRRAVSDAVTGLTVYGSPWLEDRLTPHTFR